MPVMQHVLCIQDSDKITYAVFGPFPGMEEAVEWADAMEYDSYDTFELREPEELDGEEE